MRIAIDGPSGAGKSTLAKALANRLGIIYVDTGALYRSIGYYVREHNVDPKDEKAVSVLLNDINIELVFNNGTQDVYLNGENLGDKIRQPDISMYASAVSSLPTVRKFLLETQRKLSHSKPGVIMDGRDIGTVIMPDADIKIFLTASSKNRAERRYKELQLKGVDVTLESVIEDMERRDADDRSRDIAPAVPADDAIILDNTGFTIDESVDAVLKIINSIGVM